MTLTIPEFSLVAVIGTSGSGKSTFCRRHFLPTEVLSSDTYRGYVSDDEERLDVSAHAFEALHFMLAKRLELKRLTVVDATNVQSHGREQLIEIANRYHALRVAIVIDTPPDVSLARNELRPNRQFGPHVVRNQHRDLKRTIGRLRAERWHRVYVLKPEDMDAVEIVREPSWSQRYDFAPPFDIVGDVHGCLTELRELLVALGWELDPEPRHPEGRKLVFVGDLVDRGPSSVGVLRLVMDLVARGVALCVPGNHDVRLSQALKGKDVSQGHGLRETLAEFASESPEFRREVADFLHNLVSHAMLDDGRLCVAHAGMPADMQGRGSGAVRKFALYGETTGEIDEFGLPVRYQWARDYKGDAMVVYGHTPVPEPEWLNRTIDIDTGCCFGGRLTALRYPEALLARDDAFVSVAAHATYAEPMRPLETTPASGDDGDLLSLEDVTGRRSVETRLAGRVMVREENATAALEVMSRFATDPRWLIYLPPTMSPCATSDRDGCLEYPTEAFSAYASRGVETVVCEEKHMGSRAVAVVGRSPEVIAARFGIPSGERGVITTRTGRRFFEDLATEQALIDRVAQAAESAGLFEELRSDWLLLDLELMPWSAKAIGLLRDQYAAVGAAANAHADALSRIVTAVRARGGADVEEIGPMADSRTEAAHRFREAYRRYCWTVNGLDDYRLAPFHLLASEGTVHTDRDHVWHMETLGRMCDADPAILRRTPYRVVNLGSEEEVSAACAWWESLVAGGGEGMVVKPLAFVPERGVREVQPAVKVRGPEYLRIIYGPDYLEAENLSRLRQRGLHRKRSLASREFALGVEAMERFVRRESLRRVHECVFAVLALESEPVDPRL